MKQVNVIYIGSMHQVAEYIYMNEQFSLQGIICEADKITDEMNTFSIVRNVKIEKVYNSNDMINIIQKDVTSIYIMCSYGRRVPMEHLLNVKIFNIHYADLPYYKGRHPTYWATVNNERQIGISLHEVTDKFDEGKIIDQKYEKYYIWEKEDTLFDKLTLRVPELLESLLSFLHNPDYKKSNCGGYYYHPVGRSEAYIDLKRDDPTLIYNKVRSQARVGGVKIELGNKTYRIKNIVYKSINIDEMFFIENENLYIKYLDNITIFSDSFEEVEE